MHRLAPKVYLHSRDPYHPSDFGEALQHTKPYLNFQPLAGAPAQLNLDNLDSLNSLAANPRDIYLTSIEDVTTDPAWLKGVAPDPSGKTNGAITAVVIVHDRGAGSVDAFYFYFWAYATTLVVALSSLLLIATGSIEEGHSSV